jgi:arylsulfatase A-like enzyme
MGFADGFEYFCDLYKEPNLMQNRMKTSGAVEGLGDNDDIVFPYAEDINQYFLPWFKSHLKDDIFALLWSIQPHAPYEPPERFQKFVSSSYDGRFFGKRDMTRRVHTQQEAQYLIDLYDSEIYYNDYMIGEIIHLLKEQGEYDNTLFIVVSDHGEAFGEHDLFAHGHLPYNEVMQVPMVIKLPENIHKGSKVSRLVSLLDIMPTLLAYAGIEYPADIMPILMGENLLPVLGDPENHVHDTFFCETLYSDAKPFFYGVTNDEWKYMKMCPPKLGKRNLKNLWNRLIHERIIFSIFRNPMWLLKRYGRMKGEMLFDKRNDPAENENVMDHHPEVLTTMQDHLESWQKECQFIAAKFVSGYESRDIDERIQKQLKALGYLD